MRCKVIINEKILKKVPKYMTLQYELWVRCIEEKGYFAMQMINGYRDHSLKGNRLGQRSSSLSKSWRVIYRLNITTNELIVDVLEVNNHEY